jgi:CBS domain-containing protein
MGLLHLCDEQPAVVHAETSAADAIQLMLEHRVGAVTVVDDQRVVAGIFTERDVLRKLALSGRDPAKTAVADLMTAPVILATPAIPRRARPSPS